MTKKLALKADRLTELTTEELTFAVGGDYTGDAGCILSYGKPCVTFLCTANVECLIEN